MSLIVQKYGGACLATADLIRKAAGRVADAIRQGHRVVVAVSARGDRTDELLDLGHHLSQSPPLREVDALLATGEQESSALLAIALNEAGVPAVSLTAHQLGILSNSRFGNAKVRSVDPTRVRNELAEGKAVVVTGFLGVDDAGNITTLGRGATDKTAVVLAHVLEAERCEVYKDVVGLHTADPRLVPDAQHISEVTFDEMLELSSAGAQILQADAVALAKKFKVPIHIKPHLAETGGTTIGVKQDDLESAVVIGATLSKDQAAIALHGVPDRPGQLRRIFESLAERHVNVDMIVLGMPQKDHAHVAFTCPRREIARALEAAQALSQQVPVWEVGHRTDVAKVSIIGIGMQRHYGVAATMFAALAGAQVNILMVSTSEIKITCLVPEAEAVKALQAVHAAFNLGKGNGR